MGLSSVFQKIKAIAGREQKFKDFSFLTKENGGSGVRSGSASIKEKYDPKSIRELSLFSFHITRTKSAFLKWNTSKQWPTNSYLQKMSQKNLIPGIFSITSVVLLFFILLEIRALNRIRSDINQSNNNLCRGGKAIQSQNGSNEVRLGREVGKRMINLRSEDKKMK